MNALGWYFRPLLLCLPISLICAVSNSSSNEAPTPAIGLNKFDLFTQYLGTASGGNGDDAYRRVTQAMAQKAIVDAAQIGVRYFRISATGYAPSGAGQAGDLDLWITSPDQYWARFDRMMSDLQQAGLRVVPVFVWNSVQFPAMANETLGSLLRDPNSTSWRMLDRYVREFVARYRYHPALLFYELTNEMNLGADIDLVGYCHATNSPDKCALESNYSTDDLIGFGKRLASVIRRLDQSHPISTGYSTPREAAQHLRNQPAWSAKGPDWTADSLDEFEQNMRDVHEGADIISVHIYPGAGSLRFGARPGEEYKLVQVFRRAADRIGKPLFIGEFGESDVSKGAGEPFIRKVLDEIVRLKIPYSAVWVWEFYQHALNKPYSSDASSYSLEQGYTDSVIAKMRESNKRLGNDPPKPLVRDVTPPKVVLTWPVECAVIRDASELYAVASDDSGVAPTVEFKINGTILGRVGKPPFRDFLDTSNIPSGISRIEARACDAANNCASYQTRIVTHPTSPPSSTCIP